MNYKMDSEAVGNVFIFMFIVFITILGAIFIDGTRKHEPKKRLDTEFLIWQDVDNQMCLPHDDFGTVL